MSGSCLLIKTNVLFLKIFFRSCVVTRKKTLDKDNALLGKNMSLRRHLFKKNCDSSESTSIILSCIQVPTVLIAVDALRLCLIWTTFIEMLEKPINFFSLYLSRSIGDNVTDCEVHFQLMMNNYLSAAR